MNTQHAFKAAYITICGAESAHGYPTIIQRVSGALWHCESAEGKAV